MTIHEIVMKLIGDIAPAGESCGDEKRFENLKALTELVDLLVSAIEEVSHDYKDSQEYSVKRAGEFAHKFLIDALVFED